MLQIDDKEKLGYSVNEASDATSFSKSHIRNEIHAGKLRAKLIGRRVIIPDAALREYIEAAKDWTPLEQRKAA